MEQSNIVDAAHWSVSNFLVDVSILFPNLYRMLQWNCLIWIYKCRNLQVLFSSWMFSIARKKLGNKRQVAINIKQDI